MKNGFTLLELLVTIGIVGVLAAIAFPSFKETIKKNRLTTQVNEFTGSLNYAKSEAIKRGNNVTFNAAASGWSGGWTINDSNNTLIRTYPALTSNTLSSTNNYSSFTFNNRGFINNSDTLDLCYASGETGRQITITATGQTRINSGYTCP